VATNDSGSLRHKYGSLRDLIIGMTIVLADGTVARSGGKVVKNVAGYDLHKLMTGAFGTLGVIAEVTFRLHSIPRHTGTVSIVSPDAEPLGELLMSLLDSQLSVQAMQLTGGGDGFRLDVQLQSLPEVIEVHSGAIARLAQGFNLQTAEANERVWQSRQEMFEAADAIVIKATMLPSQIAAFATAVQALGGTLAAQAAGTAWAAVPVGAAAGLIAVRQKLEAESGSLTILSQPAGSGLDTWGAPPDTLPLMRQLKLRFDPQRILNPGRFLGGI
jgi:glycolate oxidase FAD binding subunit